IKCMRTPPLSILITRDCGLFKSNARESAAVEEISSRLEFRNGRPACYGGLAEILQCGESLQQPDADAGDGAGQESDAGDHHQDAHGMLDLAEMSLHPREQRGELLDHEGRQQERDSEPRGIYRE